ncbi:aspartyl-tRNA(Asn)/glutamyl-tRNA(Gln) amidotransferase subunit A [Tamaricihabitans halophyticus]|uniref:Aspartyl-tRNA(Asn)/glutamyl-tRNA(Gln) amidotransferase subunit A n=1 Tax=Tamaricihabitans halophyticus TaxID=1262583 RepID=A0A4V2SU33_9PSEU|nr:amidase [Tamaricihabitans halophyticus]TCP53086.1 aspartyl-tRNA(Asn)/glutamyl-tRNA(Gln) amidotransferase subunit A [Tamaricihabitans halophyticus]
MTDELAVIRARNPELRALLSTFDVAVDGPTATLKDNIDVAGVPSTAGSASFATGPAETDATVTRLLREAGYLILGKNNMAEFAMGVTNQNRTFGDCRNPWDTTRIPGGSSGGSAVAVASGMSLVSLGTDTGGSGRIPASVNGITGLRPTVGRLSNRGVLPVSPSFDTVSPLARDIRTVAEVFTALDRYDPADPTSHDERRVPVWSTEHARQLRIGVAVGFFVDEVDEGVLTTVRAAIEVFEDLGCRITEVRLPDVAQAQDRMLEIMYPEAAEVHAGRLQAEPETIDPDVLRRLRIGLATAPERTAAARLWRSEFRAGVDAVFDEVDVVLTPTIPVDVPRRDAVDLAASIKDIARFTYAWSCYGGPALSVPCGFHPVSGMPVGLQLSARPWQEQLLFQAARGYEDATGWAQQGPPASTPQDP